MAAGGRLGRIKARKPLVEPPYLKSPPAVIPIDVGRQLFVDDFLIEQTTLTRTLPPRRRITRTTRSSPAAWSSATASGTTRRTASSRCGTWRRAARAIRHLEGRHPWDKPDWTSEGHQPRPDRSATRTVWLDLEEKDPERRYKLFRSVIGQQTKPWACRSTSRPTASTGASRGADRAVRRPHAPSSTTRSARCGSTASGTAGASRAPPLLGGEPTWSKGAAVAAAGPARGCLPWVGADRLDPQRPDHKITPRALQPRLRRLREPAARPVHDLARAARTAAEAERGLRRLQPRRLPLDRGPTAGPSPGLRDAGRLELGQRAVGGRLLPGRRRPALLLRAAAGATGNVDDAWRRSGATASPRWTPAKPAAR